MKQTRKGLGKNKGKGYYNILPIDSHIHSLSAKGVKSATPLSEQMTRSLIGRKIIDARQMNEKETKSEYWDSPTTMLILDDGTKIYPSQDDEGNGSGALFGQAPNGIATRFGYQGRSSTEIRAKGKLEKLDLPLTQAQRKGNLSPKEQYEVDQLTEKEMKKLGLNAKGKLYTKWKKTQRWLRASGEDEIGKRKGFSANLSLKIKDVPVSANIKIARLKPEDVTGTPEIVMKDTKGNMVEWQSLDRATGEVIGKGIPMGSPKIQKVLVNSKGDQIPRDQLVYWQKKGEKLEKISQFEANVGKDRPLKITKTLSKEQTDEYLVDSTYQMVGKTQADDEGLYAIAKHLYDNGLIGVAPITLRTGFKKHWGLITPKLSKDRFSVIVRLTRAKIKPQELKIPKDVKVARKTKAPTIKVKELF